MKFYNIDIPAKRVTLYPIGDFHYGSRQCDADFVRQVISEIKDNDEARWIGMGDFLENAIVGSKSDVYLQTSPPKEQVEFICDLLSPIAKKGLFMVGGNHEARTMRVVGLQPEQLFNYKLGVPFAGYSAMAVIDLEKAKTPRSFSLYVHHNYGGGYTPGGKINRAAKLRDIVPTVDATFSGHFHTTSRTPVTWWEAGYKKSIKKTGYDYITGSALSWNESYAEEKAKPPSTVEHIKVTFIGSTSGSHDNKRQVYEIIAKELS